MTGDITKLFYTTIEKSAHTICSLVIEPVTKQHKEGKDGY